MDKKRFENLLDGWLSQSLSAKEIDQFLNALQLPEFQQILDNRMEQDLDSGIYSGLTSDADRQKALERLRTQIHPFSTASKTRIRSFKFWAAAAIFLLIAGSAIFLFIQKPSTKERGQKESIAGASEIKLNKPTLMLENGTSIVVESSTRVNHDGFVITEDGIVYNDVPGNKVGNHKLYNPAGSKPIRLTFADGTVVLLNSASSFTYPNRFNGAKREVDLDGEAYFDVKKNKEKPFIVSTNLMDVKVLGTSFNIKSFSDDGKANTTLFRGSVEVTVRKQPDRKVILKPNESIEIVENRNIAKEELKMSHPSSFKISLTTSHAPEKSNADKDILWTENKLAFDYMELKEVALMIERWYGVKIEIKNEELLEKRFTGVFENRPIEDVLRALQLVGKFTYKTEGNTIIIK